MATLTGNDARREQRLQNLMLDRLVYRYERRISREIGRTMRAAADNIAAGADSVVSEHKTRLGRILNDLWVNSSREFSEHILGKEKAAARVTQLKQAQIRPTQIIDGIMRDWILSIGARHITEISDTTRADIQLVISEGIKEGLSEREIAKNINAIAPIKAATRAQTIARTETHSSANASAQASAQATGMEMVREWAASEGPRTRQTHDEADGQRVGMNEPFIVGGYELQYPGDPNGPAREVINCRCAVLYVLE